MDKIMEERINQLREARQKAMLGGGTDKIARQHQRGKLSARERLDKLLDPGSFIEFDALFGLHRGVPGDGVVAGLGTIDGRKVSVFSQDITVLGGTIGTVHHYKICRAVEWGTEMGIPVIGLFDSGGARAEKLEDSRERDMSRPKGYDEGRTVFFPNTEASGVVPQISAILGTCAGIAVYSPALTDFIYMVDGISYMFITGPRVIKSVMGEDITFEDLGGPTVHMQLSGVADFRMPSEEECFRHIRRLLTFLPSNNRQPPPVVNTGDDPMRFDDSLADIVPTNPFTPFDVRLVIKRLADNGDFLEVKPEFAPEMVVGFGRMAGQTVGFVANQSLAKAGSLTVDSSDKQARFMRFCDCFNIPLVLLVDTPAYFPGSEQEHAGIIRHGAKVLYALCEAVVPRISVIIRRLYGGGTLGMGIIPGLATDLVYAWPTAEIGFFGSEQIVEFFYGEEMRKMADPGPFRQQKIKEYKELYTHPLAVAQDSTLIHDVIEPRETRRRLIQSLEMLQTKRVRRQPKRHGNIPL